MPLLLESWLMLMAVFLIGLAIGWAIWGNRQDRL